MTPANQTIFDTGNDIVHPLFDDVLGLKVGTQEGLPTWAFAILRGDEMLLIDAVYSRVQPAIAALQAHGIRPAALLLTHRHVVATGDFGVRDLARTWAVPVMLHPADATHRQAAPFGPFVDPVGSALLARFGVSAVPFPGHTDGHVLYHLDRHGGIVFAGDSAMGVREGSNRLAFVRAPVFFNVDDDRLRAGWSAHHFDVRSFAPFHGVPAIDRDDLATLMAPLTRAEPTTDFTTR